MSRMKTSELVGTTGYAEKKSCEFVFTLQTLANTPLRRRFNPFLDISFDINTCSDREWISLRSRECNIWSGMT